MHECRKFPFLKIDGLVEGDTSNHKNSASISGYKSSIAVSVFENTNENWSWKVVEEGLG